MCVVTGVLTTGFGPGQARGDVWPWARVARRIQAGSPYGASSVTARTQTQADPAGTALPELAPLLQRLASLPRLSPEAIARAELRLTLWAFHLRQCGKPFARPLIFCNEPDVVEFEWSENGRELWLICEPNGKIGSFREMTGEPPIESELTDEQVLSELEWLVGA